MSARPPPHPVLLTNNIALQEIFQGAQKEQALKTPALTKKKLEVDAAPGTRSPSLSISISARNSQLTPRWSSPASHVASALRNAAPSETRNRTAAMPRLEPVPFFPFRGNLPDLGRSSPYNCFMKARR